MHLVASAVVTIVLVSVTCDAVRLSRGQLKRSPWVYAWLIVVSGLATWQAAIWLGSDRPDATLVFRAGVILQLSCAVAIAGLSLVSLGLYRRQAS